MIADDMLAVIRETYPDVRVDRDAHGRTFAVHQGSNFWFGKTRWQAIFAAYKAVRKSQGKAVFVS